MSCSNCQAIQNKNNKAIEVIQKLRIQYESDQSLIQEQKSQIADLEAANERMRKMLLAVKDHLKQQKGGAMPRHKSDSNLKSSQTLDSSPRPPTPPLDDISVRPPSPPGEERRGSGPRPNGEATKSPYKAKRNTLPLLGLGALLEASPPPSPPESPRGGHPGSASPKKRPGADRRRPSADELNDKVATILRLQNEVAQNRLERERIVEEKRRASSGAAPKYKPALKSPKKNAKTPPKKARVRFVDSPNETRENRLARLKELRNRPLEPPPLDSDDETPPALPDEPKAPGVLPPNPAPPSPPPSPPAEPLEPRTPPRSAQTSKEIEAAWASVEDLL